MSFLETVRTLSVWHFLRKGVGRKYTGIIIFLEGKIGGHISFDDQILGSPKMTIGSLFILFKKTDFDTTIMCIGIVVGPAIF